MEIEKLKNLLKIEIITPKENEKYAAVGVILKNDSVLLVKRIEDPRDPWSGQVSFPGGHFEKNDKNTLNTAIREVKEEVGIDLKKCADLIGSLSIQKPHNMPDLNVIPYLFTIKSQDFVITGSEEISYPFWVNLNVLIEQKDNEEFYYQGNIIWGLTSRILKELIYLLSKDL